MAGEPLKMFELRLKRGGDMYLTTIQQVRAIVHFLHVTVYTRLYVAAPFVLQYKNRNVLQCRCHFLNKNTITFASAL